MRTKSRGEPAWPAYTERLIGGSIDVAEARRKGPWQTAL